MALAFAVIIAALLILINTYFLTASRDMIFASKRTMLQNKASIVTTSLAAMDSLNPDNVAQLMELLDIPSSMDHITIIDANGETLYDTAGITRPFDRRTA